MALRISYKKKLHGVTFMSGHIYSFKYRAWHRDPNPLIIFMYAIEGINPSTGHQWRLIQAVNFSYLPRAVRRQFAQIWTEVFRRTNGNTRFTYNILKQRFPYMDIAIRRYMLKPTYYISKLKEVPFDNMEKAITGTWQKDFSKSVKVALLQKFRTATKGHKDVKKKARERARFFGFKV
jgi:hypothetical protein